MESQESKHPSLELADFERDREALRADCAAGFKIGNAAEGNEVGPYCRVNIKIEPREPEDDLFKVVGFKIDNAAEGNEFGPYCRANIKNEPPEPEDDLFEVHPDDDDEEDNEEADDVLTRHREDVPNAAGPADDSVEVHHPDGDDKEVASDEDDEEADDIFTMPPPLLLPNHEEIAKIYCTGMCSVMVTKRDHQTNHLCVHPYPLIGWDPYPDGVKGSGVRTPCPFQTPDKDVMTKHQEEHLREDTKKLGYHKCPVNGCDFRYRSRFHMQVHQTAVHPFRDILLKLQRAENPEKSPILDQVQDEERMLVALFVEMEKILEVQECLDEIIESSRKLGIKIPEKWNE